MAFKQIWFEIEFAVRGVIWRIGILLNPRFWLLAYAACKQFKYDFGYSVFSRRGKEKIAKYDNLSDSEGIAITQWTIETGMQLSPIYLKEL